MNTAIIARNKRDDSVVAPRITKEERARRLEAVNYARASVELEGFKSNPALDLPMSRPENSVPPSRQGWTGSRIAVWKA
ncbi:MAG: antitoxin VbhA family protein [Zoogloeaceae bacterium]|jgi:hypothetical protein|nr:antitoxin VbhA family protein [Zoogloeaceae bacterium]